MIVSYILIVAGVFSVSQAQNTTQSPFQNAQNSTLTPSKNNTQNATPTTTESTVQNATLSPYVNNGVADISVHCIEKYGQVDDFRGQVRKINRLGKLSETVKCLLTCSLEEDGFLGKDGKVDEKAVNIYFEDMKGDKNLTEVILQAVTTCKAEEVPEDSYCLSGTRFIRCMLIKKFEHIRSEDFMNHEA